MCYEMQIKGKSTKTLRGYTESGLENGREKRFCQRNPKCIPGCWLLVRDASMRSALVRWFKRAVMKW